jgi:hypothetical protein
LDSHREIAKTNRCESIKLQKVQEALGISKSDSKEMVGPQHAGRLWIYTTSSLLHRQK